MCMLAEKKQSRSEEKWEQEEEAAAASIERLLLLKCKANGNEKQFSMTLKKRRRW
jgi:hypothetical protein